MDSKPVPQGGAGPTMGARSGMRLYLAASDSRRSATAPSDVSSRELLDALDEHAIVSVADLHGRIVYANDRFCVVSGYTREELIGQTHRLLKSGVHDAAFYQALWHTIASGQVWHGELTNRRKDGSLYWVQSTIVPVLDEHGLPERYISIRTDISKQKLLEQEAREQEDFLRRITEAFGLGVLVADRQGRCLFASAEALRILRMARDQVVGWSVIGLFEDLTKQTPSGRQSRAAKADDAPWSPGRYQATVRREGGKGLAVAMHVRALRQAHRDTSVVIHFRDDTGERRALAGARREKRQAEKADQAKATFLAQLSHEVRTPLAGILGLVRLARTEPADSTRLRGCLEHIERSADALAELVGEVLDVSKIESGRFSLSDEPFDLRALVQSVWDAYSVPAAQKDIRLELIVASDVPGHVRGDPVRVRQILVNYLVNALKFTQQGSVTLRVVPSARSGVRFEVSDTGIGIAPQVLKGLFTLFNQGDASTAARFGGTGLGLAICRQLARQMGGRVGAESTPGRGSVFWAELPLVAVEQAQTDGAEVPEGSLAPLGMRVLLAEDNEVNVLVATAMLEAWGCEVVVAGDGVQAMTALDAAEAAFDVVLLDLQMPAMGGREAAVQMRRRFDARRLPILALTAAGFAHEREQCLALGMNDYLTKPIDAAALHAALSRVWRARGAGG